MAQELCALYHCTWAHTKSGRPRTSLPDTIDVSISHDGGWLAAACCHTPAAPWRIACDLASPARWRLPAPLAYPRPGYRSASPPPDTCSTPSIHSAASIALDQLQRDHPSSVICSVRRLGDVAGLGAPVLDGAGRPRPAVSRTHSYSAVYRSLREDFTHQFDATEIQRWSSDEAAESWLAALGCPVRCMPTTPRLLAFLCHWSVKEAVVKAIGCGIPGFPLPLLQLADAAVPGLDNPELDMQLHVTGECHGDFQSPAALLLFTAPMLWDACLVTSVSASVYGLPDATVCTCAALDLASCPRAWQVMARAGKVVPGR